MRGRSPCLASGVPGSTRNGAHGATGDGPERERLRRGAAPAVIFAGARLDVPDWLAAADVVAAPSRWEGMSLAVLEALARGRAVVTTNTAGAAEVLAHAPDAIAPIEDAAALANALVARLLDPARAQAEGLAGRARVEREFDVRLAAERVAALYAELMNASSSTPDPTL